ncbi:polysaccharide deacetylase family protein [Devosia epidermidihirudinis]|uniref:polysaccharide deacetylase family protein n=1 Tax=Devosia epidermidihirudinis TaxID=1293439 RepID=UPI000AE94B79|nr:polysaccharide deacetylase family protein [Devosia epidermidihirudinis]
MSLSRFAISFVFVAAALAGCAKPPVERAVLTQTTTTEAPVVTGAILKASAPISQQPIPERIFSTGHLGGRTLAVGSSSDIALRQGEVILTFDDGPRPGKTSQILASLDHFGVKATFLMLGSAAEANPKLAQLVANKGHTVGSHTFGHVDLTTLSRQEAVDEIAKGERAVALALAGSGQTLSPFFRFPYLAQNGFLRTNLMQGSVVVLDVDVDSKDYYKETADVVLQRTLSRLDARGSGIVLFHDIHQRTVDLLPRFLSELEQRGYTVVRLVPKDNGVFGRDVITADVPSQNGTL